MTTVPMIPDGYQAVTPWVIVRGVPAFIDFLVEVFDAKETIRMYADDGVRVSHAEVRINGAPVMISRRTVRSWSRRCAPRWSKSARGVRLTACSRQVGFAAV